MNGILLKRVCSVFWAILGLFILALYGAGVKDPDLLWGMASKDLLPVGLLGLMLACLLAALMSTTDTHMVVISGLLTRNVYQPLFPDRSDKHYLKVGRLLGIVHIAGGVFMALLWKANLLEMLIFMVTINVTMGPAVLMAFLWRRTNTAGVWVSMGVSLLLTLFIPVTASLIPAARYNASLHLEVQPPAATRQYMAKTWDVEKRQEQIAEWQALEAAGMAEGRCPAPLAPGDTFEDTYTPPKHAVFWQKGIKMDADGRAYGEGLFLADIYMMHKLGFDMSHRSVAFLKSAGMGFKLVFPFAALILFGLFGKQNDERAKNLWYGKLLTPVQPDPARDAAEVKRTEKDPHRFDHTKLWPNSDWNLRRWDWQDWKGILISLAAMKRHWWPDVCPGYAGDVNHKDMLRYNRNELSAKISDW